MGMLLECVESDSWLFPTRANHQSMVDIRCLKMVECDHHITIQRHLKKIVTSKWLNGWNDISVEYMISSLRILFWSFIL